MKRMYDENEIKSIASESGGGKLYRHDVNFFVGPDEGYRITVYNTNATPYTPQTFFADSNNNSIYCCGVAEINVNFYPIYTIAIVDNIKRIVYINSDNKQTAVNIDVSQLSGSDKVTEL